MLQIIGFSRLIVLLLDLLLSSAELQAVAGGGYLGRGRSGRGIPEGSRTGKRRFLGCSIGAS